ncbi:hypothetical protein [Morganella psychrotolerans]|uniref:hypothetical protein n=1 Tax=Morganella psychrotolerans TaxID=368603 RepID=UPI0039B06EB7
MNRYGRKNITVTTTDESGEEMPLREERKAGLLSFGGIGLSIGKQSLKQTTDSGSQLYKGSTMGGQLLVDDVSGFPEREPAGGVRLIRQPALVKGFQDKTEKKLPDMTAPLSETLMGLISQITQNRNVRAFRDLPPQSKKAP